MLVQIRRLIQGQILILKRRRMQPTPNLRKSLSLHLDKLRVSLYQAQMHPNIMRVLMQLSFHRRSSHPRLKVLRPLLRVLRLQLQHLLLRNQTPYMSTWRPQIRFIRDGVRRECNSFIIDIALLLSRVEHDVVFQGRSEQSQSVQKEILTCMLHLLDTCLVK